jgi:hypothetical protein|tara:strand:- start:655 stop:807 length:153 start_codon:yes stop_codon:yes gene_type:complete
MTWTYDLTQQSDDKGNLIPVWTVTQWNTDNPNVRYETSITSAIKVACYPD